MVAAEVGFRAVELDQEAGPLAEEGRACCSVRVASVCVRTVAGDGAGASSSRTSRGSGGGVRRVSG
jgi:hypothetical protein